MKPKLEELFVGAGVIIKIGGFHFYLADRTRLLGCAANLKLAEEGALTPRAANRAKGGTARAAKLSPERRREIAMLGVRARWGKP